MALTSNDASASDDITNFFDVDMTKDRSLASFYYMGGHLSIYEGRVTANEDHRRYYVTPLAEIDTDSIKSLRSEIENRYKIMFNIILWRSDIADEAAKVLGAFPLNRKVQKGQVHPLPIFKVRLSAKRLAGAYEPDTAWKWNINQRQSHTFTIYAADELSCERMVAEMNQEPGSFASLIQLELAMSAEKRASREITVTASHMNRSRTFAQLQNMEAPAGERFLQSKDLNNMAQEIVSSVVASEVITGDYIERSTEVNFAQLLERQLSMEMANSERLTEDQWKSVFWQDDFSRPDNYSRFLNHALTHDAGTDAFTYSDESLNEAKRRVLSDITRGGSQSSSKEYNANIGFQGFSLGGGYKTSNSNSFSSGDKHENETQDKNYGKMSRAELAEFFKKKDLQVEWNGKVFVPKSLDLHRVNTAQLLAKSTIATQQVHVQTIPLTVKIDVTVGTIVGDDVAKDHIKILIDQVRAELDARLDTFEKTVRELNASANRTEEIYSEISRREQMTDEKIDAKLNDQNEKLTRAKAEISDDVDKKLQATNEDIDKKLEEERKRVDDILKKLEERIKELEETEKKDSTAPAQNQVHYIPAQQQGYSYQWQWHS